MPTPNKYTIIEIYKKDKSYLINIFYTQLFINIMHNSIKCIIYLNKIIIIHYFIF